MLHSNVFVVVTAIVFGCSVDALPSTYNATGSPWANQEIVVAPNGDTESVMRKEKDIPVNAKGEGSNVDLPSIESIVDARGIITPETVGSRQAFVDDQNAAESADKQGTNIDDVEAHLGKMIAKLDRMLVKHGKHEATTLDTVEENSPFEESGSPEVEMTSSIDTETVDIAGDAMNEPKVAAIIRNSESETGHRLTMLFTFGCLFLLFVIGGLVALGIVRFTSHTDCKHKEVDKFEINGLSFQSCKHCNKRWMFMSNMNTWVPIGLKDVPTIAPEKE
jgi:hypothetical protein